jgi:hypothetical protein
MTKKAFKLKTSPASYLTIYGDAGKLGEYLKMSAFEEVAEVPAVAATVDVSGHVRKRFPGHAGYQVEGHSRSFLKETDRPGGGGMPGNRFWMERPRDSTDPAPNSIRARAFTYVGTWKALKETCLAQKLGPDFVLRNSSGRSKIIKAAAAA